MKKTSSTLRTTFAVAVTAALAAALLVSVVALAAPPPGKGKPANPGKPAQPGKSGAATAQYQYGPAGKQYGKTKVTLCHKGKVTITVAAPAVKAHLRHGDTLGRCP